METWGREKRGTWRCGGTTERLLGKENRVKSRWMEGLMESLIHALLRSKGRKERACTTFVPLFQCICQLVPLHRILSNLFHQIQQPSPAFLALFRLLLRRTSFTSVPHRSPTASSTSLFEPQQPPPVFQKSSSSVPLQDSTLACSHIFRVGSEPVPPASQPC